MSYQCAECTYLDLNSGDCYGKFYCERKYERHFASDPECGRFCRAYSRDYGTIQNALEYSNSHTSSGCYITTMLCNILMISDDYLHLNEMRNFRNKTLQKDDKYKELLVEYDIIGPKIAEFLSKDPLKEKLAIQLFFKYIVPIIKAIKSQNNDEAVNLYVAMTNFLKDLYGLNGVSISKMEIDAADINKSGHGSYQKKAIAQI